MPATTTRSPRGILHRWTERLGNELRFPVNKLLGRRQRLTVAPLGQPVLLEIEARRELIRATSFALEADLVQRILDHLQPGDVVYDVGANIGMISLTLALHPAGRQCRLDSFEPEPRNFAQLARNIEINHLADRVTPHQIALGKDAADVELFVRGTAGEGRHSLVAAKGSTHSIKVAQRTASDIARSTGRIPTVVKIDVEGAEGQVLAGLADVIKTSRPREIFMEIHPKGDRDRMPDGESISRWLGERGYTLAWSHERRSGEHRHYR